MICYAVVDTNVLVSALIIKNPEAAPRQVFRAMLGGKIIPLYHQEILAEYEEVLSRPKFHLQKSTIQPAVFPSFSVKKARKRRDNCLIRPVSHPCSFFGGWEIFRNRWSHILQEI